jgi:hypothetical protein
VTVTILCGVVMEICIDEITVRFKGKNQACFLEKISADC